MKNFIKYKTEAIVVNRSTHFLLAVLIFAALLLYVYFANVAVRTLAALEKTEEDIQSLSVEVSEMESKRLALENKVSAQVAADLGFVEAGRPTFIVKDSKKAALSFRANQN